VVGDGVVVVVVVIAIAAELVVSKAVVKMGLPIELIGASVAAAVGSAFKFDSVFAATPAVASSTSAIVVAWLFELLSVASAELISTL
jgi:hypothetical protein